MQTRNRPKWDELEVFQTTCAVQRCGIATLETRAAFTLLELLVCIAIIALLVAMALPALASAMAKGKRARCESNLRQIGLGLRLYVDDHAGAYPAYGLPETPWEETPTNRAAYWDAMLLPYATKAVFVCPTHTGETTDSNWDLRWQGSVYPNKSYGYNGYGTEMAPNWQHLSPGLSAYQPNSNSPRYISECQLAAPADMISLTDCDTTADDDGDGDPNPQWLYSLTFTGKWHSQAALGAFCDGHAECHGSNVWHTARARWNNDNTAH